MRGNAVTCEDFLRDNAERIAVIAARAALEKVGSHAILEGAIPDSERAVIRWPFA
jgi:predicted transcriptional regulator